MFKKTGIVLCILAAFIFAMGEKPQGGAGGSAGQAGYRQPPRETPIEELTADQLYRRALLEHSTAQNMEYPEQTAKAIKAMELFLQKYAGDKRGLELSYYLSLDYTKNNQPQLRPALLANYFSAAPTSHETYNAMRVESLSAYVWERNTVSANELYAELRDFYATNKALLAKVHQDMLPVLEAENNIDGQKAVYEFFRAADNRNYLRNYNNYYIYTYRLALLYYNEKNYQAAAPLFQEIVAQKAKPALSFFVESAENYLKQMPN